MSERPSNQVVPRPGELSITAGRGNGALTFAVRGEIDLASVPRLVAELRRAEAAEAKLVVIDLADVEFIDSSGLQALLKARERLSRHGLRLSLSRPSAQVRQLLELTGTLGLFSVEGLEQVSTGPEKRGSAA
jgi:anti-sigma B factor antagonist